MRKSALVASIATIAALALASVAFARPTAHASVVGGLEAAPGTWPSAAFVAQFNGNEGTACTGTVVAPRVILTAAHCVTDASPSDYRVVAGSLDWAAESAHISKVVMAATWPNWNDKNRFGDAAVLILAEPTTAPAMPMATFQDIALLRAPRSVPFAGWGQTAISDMNPPSALRTGTVVLQSPAYCGSHSAMFLSSYLPAAMLCAIDTFDFAVGPCHGDSGGPLVAKRPDGTTVEVGITSAVSGPCSVRFPAYYTRVDMVASWVQSWIDAAAAAGSGPVTPPGPLPPAPNGAPPLGQLTNHEIGGDLRAQLTAKMGSRFRGAKRFKSRCARKSASSVNCKVSWVRQGKTFAGVVRVFLRYDAVTRLVVVDSRAKFQRPHGG